MSIGSAVVAGLTIVTDRPTDRQTDHASPSVRVGRIYVRSTAMRPRNGNEKKPNECDCVPRGSNYMGQQSEIDATSARCGRAPEFNIRRATAALIWPTAHFFPGSRLTHLTTVVAFEEFGRPVNGGDISLDFFGDIYTSPAASMIEHADPRQITV